MPIIKAKRFRVRESANEPWKDFPAASIKGDDGKSAYDIAVENGYTGSETEFAEQLTKNIPTKTSELENDSNYITASEVYAKSETYSNTEVDNFIKTLATWINTIADSDDVTLDQMSEVVAYIKDNRDLIDSITTSKVSVSDIIDNLTTRVPNKPLSAKQGAVLKSLIDNIAIPDALPNPHPIVFTGAVNASYDGSAEKTIEIPEGDSTAVHYTPQELSSEQQKQTRKNIDAQKQVYAVSTGNPWNADDCINAPVRGLKLYGASEQKNYVGKNLFKFDIDTNVIAANLSQFTKTNTSIKILTESEGANGYIIINEPLNLKANKTYTFSFEISSISSGRTLRVVYFAIDSLSNILNPTATFTPTIDTACRIGIYLNGSGKIGDYAEITNMQLEIGSAATPYEPYVGGMPSPSPDYPQEVRYNDLMYSMIGRNLWNDNADFAVVTNYPSGNGYLGYPLQLKPNTKYGVSLQKNMSYGSEAGNYIVLTSESWYGQTGVKGSIWITHPSYTNNNLFPNEVKYFITGSTGIIWINLNSKTAIEFKSNIENSIEGMFIFEAPNQEKFAYTPYFDGGSATAPELYAVGDVRDEWDAVTGHGIRRIKKLVLDGTEQWNIANPNYNKIDACDRYIILNAIGISIDGNSVSLCNSLQYIHNIGIWIMEGYPNKFTIDNKNLLHLNIANDVLGVDPAINTSDEITAAFKAFLASKYAEGNPVIVYYPLETPEEFTTTPASQLTTPDGYAQMLPSGDGVAGDVEIEYAVDIEKRYVPKTNFDNFLISQTSPIMRRNIYRGKDLGTEVTPEQKAAIQSGTFDDLFIGDFWTINGLKYVIADMDYWYNCGDTAFTKHHLVMIPDGQMYTAKMNETNTTAGGYVGSLMYAEGLNQAKETINAAFGDMVLTHREYLTNAVSNNYASAGAWYNSNVELMNEIMVYGSNIFSNVANGNVMPSNQTIDKQQLALYRLNPQSMPKRQTIWLKDIASSSSFSIVNLTGDAGIGTASRDLGVYPTFPIG